MIDETRHAVGVVLASLQKASPEVLAQNVNYALKIGYLRNLLADLPDIGTGHASAKPASMVSLVAQLRGAVFMIVGEKPAQP